MFRKLLVVIGTLGIAAGLAFATVGPYPSVGLYWFDNTDPTLGAGMVAPLNQLLIRTDTPSIYYKSGSANTAWTKLGSGTSSGGTVTSVTCSTGLSCTPNPIVNAGTIAVSLTPTTCAAGTAEVSTAADGTSSCLTFFNTAGTALSSSGSTVNLNITPTTCAVGTAATAIASNGTATCTAFTPSGSISGTTNTIAKFTSSSAIGNSSVTDDATTWAINTNKVSVIEASGNTTIAGTLGVTGLSTLTGGFDSTAARALVGKFTGTLQATSATGTQDDFVISDSTTTLRWSASSANVTFDGFKCGSANCSASDDGRFLLILADTTGSGNIMTLAANAGGSNAANQIDTLGGNMIIKGTAVANSTGGALLQYDGTATKWRVMLASTARIEQALQFDGLGTFTAGATVGSPNLTLNGNANLVLANGVGHIKSTGTAVTFAAASCGTGPAANGSTDISGRITTGTTNTGCTLNWATQYTTQAPACVCSTETPDITFKCVPSTTQLVITYAANSSNVFDYICHATAN